MFRPVNSNINATRNKIEVKKKGLDQDFFENSRYRKMSQIIKYLGD